MISNAKAKKSLISPVWIVPAVALAIALWLVVKAYVDKGVMIQITFESASDILPGQTLVKLNHVQVGAVKTVTLSPDLKSVTVDVEINRDISHHLSEHTRFWVVTSSISASGVSNLGTLITGVYIEMDPGEAGAYTTVFEGLNEMPAFESDEPGSRYILQSENLGSLDRGSAVHYRQIRVGEVTRYQFNEQQNAVDIEVFIKAPYDKMIQTRTRFWNVSGFGVSMNSDGLKAQMASLASLVSGGVAFDNLATFTETHTVDEGHRFHLYPDKDTVLEGRFNIRHYYRLRFSGSVKGLNAGAPVEFYGIKVGEVVDVVLDRSDNADRNISVFIAMEPQRLDANASPSRVEADKRMETMVKAGLHAQMKTGNLLTGSRFIDLAYADADSVGEFVAGGKYSEIPTLADESLDQLTAKLTGFADKLSAVPVETIGRDLSGSLGALRRLLETLEKQGTLGKVDDAMGELEQTLKSATQALTQVDSAMQGVDSAIAPDSALNYQLSEMLKSLGDAARSVNTFVDELNRHPSALIRGAKKDD